MSSTVQRFEYGDAVRHQARPEWGIGTVTSAQDVPGPGPTVQRLTIRFPNAGLKTVTTEYARLERVERRSGAGDESGMDVWQVSSEEGWLRGVAAQKVEERMSALPPDARDPFQSIARRLAFTLDLFRFDRTGRGVVDWAVAQTGLDDPLSRFTRHELEVYFDRWLHALRAHLAELVEEARREGVDVDPILEGAPPAAQRAVRGRDGRR